MSSNYQRKKSKYVLPGNVYMQIKYRIKDYDRLLRDKTNILYGGASASNGMPRGCETSDPTQDKAIKIAYIDRELDAIDQSVIEIRGEYSKKVYENFDPIKAYWNYDYFNYMFVRTKEDSNGPCRRTWSYFKGKFSYKIAKRLNLF